MAILGDVTLIFPVRNERNNIETLLLKAEVEIGLNLRIVVVDDGCCDGTDEIVNNFILKNKRISLVKNNKRGLAQAIKTGIDSSVSDIVVWMDADLSMPVETVPEIIRELRDYDVIVGSRYLRHGRDLREEKLRVFTSRLFNILSQKILGTKTRDLTSGFIAARKDVINKLAFNGRYGEYCIGLIFQAEQEGLRIREFPYILGQRMAGKSKIGSNPLILLRNSLYYFKMVLMLKLKDLFACKDNIS